MITTSYTAKQEGEAQFFIAGDKIRGSATLAIPFEVVECQLTLSFGAGYSKSSPVGTVSTEFYGTGGVHDDGTGVIMGGGTFQYILTVPYTPPNAGLTCDEYVKSVTDSTFVALGKASFTWVHIDLKWTPFDITPGVATCTDTSGRKFLYTKIPGEKIDLNTALKTGTLNFGAPSSWLNFDFGKGWGIAWLVKRKGSGK
jgi:hypothetical protein